MKNFILLFAKNFEVLNKEHLPFLIWLYPSIIRMKHADIFILGFGIRWVHSQIQISLLMTTSFKFSMGINILNTNANCSQKTKLCHVLIEIIILRFQLWLKKMVKKVQFH